MPKRLCGPFADYPPVPLPVPLALRDLLSPFWFQKIVHQSLPYEDRNIRALTPAFFFRKNLSFPEVVFCFKPTEIPFGCDNRLSYFEGLAKNESRFRLMPIGPRTS